MTQIQFNQFFFIFQIEASSEPGTKMLSKLDLFFQRSFFFILARLVCPVHHSCPKNMFYFDLRLPKKMVITIRNFSEWDIDSRSGDLTWKFSFSQFGWENGWHAFKVFFKNNYFWKSSILKIFIFPVPEYDDLIKRRDPLW